MDEEFFFMALAGLGVSLAGFAGLIAALDHRPSQHPAVAAWRIRNIVIHGFAITMAGFATVALWNLTGKDLTVTVRIASGLLLIANLAPMPSQGRSGPAWPAERGRRFAIGSTLVLAAADAANIAIGGLGLLQLLFVLQLLGPLSIFFNTVRDVAGRDTTGAGD